MLYFDSAATTPLHPEAKAEMLEVLDVFGNPASKHIAGYEAQKKMSQCLERIATVLGVGPDHLAITNGGTDGNRRIVWELRNRMGRENVYCSDAEHSSLWDEFDEVHQFHAEDFSTLSQNAQAIVLMKANNETGAMYDTETLRAQFPDALILNDWVQGAGKIPFDFSDADFATLSAHKFYGPKNVGLIYMKHPEDFPEISKDTHTKNISLIAGMARALELIPQQNQIQIWQKQIEEMLEQKIPDMKIHGENEPRVPGITNVAIKGVRGSELMTESSEKESLCISTGSACTSDILAPPRVIQNIEPNPDYQYPIRISLHQFLKQEDIDHLCEVLPHYALKLRDRSTFT